MDFDFTTETITPDNTNILTIGGNGGLELPPGTTAQRPGSAANGLLRYNSDTGQVEAYYYDMWNSLLNSIRQQVTVQVSPGPGEFSSIAAAVASITDASISKPYTVLVHPGVYVEPVITMKPYVNVAGVDEYGVMVEPATQTQHLFNMVGNSNLAFLRVKNTGTGYVAVNCEDFTAGSTVLHKIGALDCGISFRVKAVNSDTVVYIEYCDASGGDTGLDVISSNGFLAYANCENFYLYASETTGLNHTTGVKLDGTNVDVNIIVYGFEGASNTGTAIEASNGVNLVTKVGRVFNWDKGVINLNVGAACNMSISTTFLDNVTKDMDILHPSTTGTLNASVTNMLKVTTASASVILLYSDIDTGDYIQTGQFLYGDEPANLTNITPLLLEGPTLGLLRGGVLSVVTGTTVNVSAGSGYIKDGQNIKYITWAAGALTLTPGTSPYIYINSSGVISQSPALSPLLTTIAIGRAVVGASSIITAGPNSVDMPHYGNGVDNYLRTIFGPMFGSGCIVTENAVTPRSLDVTAGSYYFSIRNLLPSAGTGITFLDLIQVSGTTSIVPSTQVSNTQYLSGGNLVSLSTGYYAKHTLYTAEQGSLQKWFMQHATAQYATLQEAIDAPLAMPLIDPGAIPTIAAIIVGQGITNIVDILDLRPRLNKTSSGTIGVSDHGDLTGLADDDHLQYLRTDGTRVLTGSLNLGTNNIINIGTANGVTIESHASRHLPNGADPLTTATAVSINTSTPNAEGVANSFARSDHTHSISGVQAADATLTALAAYNTNGLLTQTATDTFTGRTIIGTASRVSITNGNGVAGNPTINIDTGYVGQSSITTLGTISAGTWTATAIAAGNGGTGITTYTIGDILYASGTSTLSKLSDIATGNALISGGVNTAPSWGKIGLATHISGTLAVANGGTGLTTAPTNGQIDIGSTGVGFVRTTITPGTGISVTNAAGSITLANTGVTSFSAGTTGLTPNTSTTGAITLAGTLAVANGGTGLTAAPANGQLLIGNSTNYTLSTLTAGTGISVTNAAGSITLANTGVVSVGLALPSIFTVSGSPVTTSGTLTGTLATQANNTIFAGPATGGPLTPTFRSISLLQNDISDVVITSPTSGQVIAYNSGTSKWVNTGAVGSNAAGLIGVGQSGAAAWTLLSGTRYYADFAHNLGTTNVVITLFNTANDSVIIADSIVLTNANTVRVTMVGNTRTIKVVVVANGQSIAAGGSTPSSVITAKDGVTISAAATKLNFTGQAVGVVDAGSGTTNITIGSRFSYFANSLDTPNNADFAVNVLSPVTTDPTYASLNVRSFSNTTEQGVGCTVSIPSGATTLTVKIRGRAQTAPGVASVVQPRLYYRLLPNNSAVGAWSAAQELANIAIPTNANFQYGTQTILLSTLGLTSGNLYQFEFTRRIAGVTGTNLAANFLMAELTLEFA